MERKGQRTLFSRDNKALQQEKKMIHINKVKVNPWAWSVSGVGSEMTVLDVTLLGLPGGCLQTTSLANGHWEVELSLISQYRLVGLRFALAPLNSQHIHFLSLAGSKWLSHWNVHLRGNQTEGIFPKELWQLCLGLSFIQWTDKENARMVRSRVGKNLVLLLRYRSRS